MALSAVVTAALCAAGMTPLLAICCGLLAAGICGAFSGALIARFRIQPIIITLVVMFVARACAQMIAGETPVNLPAIPFKQIGLFKFAGIPIQVIIIAIAVGIKVFITRKTAFARRVEAIGDNRTAARLVGINIFTTTVVVYALCGLLCGIAGNLESAKLLSADPSKLGRLIELDAIAAVAIGGTSFSGGRARILGTVLGAIVIQLVTIIVTMNDISFEYSLLFKAVILVLAVWAQREK